MIHACNPVIWSEQAPMERNRLFFGEKIFLYLFQKIFGDVAQDLLFSYSVSQECNQYILAVLCPDKFFHFWQKYVRIAVLSCHS